MTTLSGMVAALGITVVNGACIESVDTGPEFELANTTPGRPRMVASTLPDQSNVVEEHGPRAASGWAVLGTEADGDRIDIG